MSKKPEVGEGWAVVTGASSGLGALFAEKLAQRGMPLVLAGRDEARLTEVRQRVERLAPGVDVELVVGDLGSQAGVDALIAVLDGRVDRRPGQQRGLWHLRPVPGDRSRPRPRSDRRQRRRVGSASPMRCCPECWNAGAAGFLNVASTIAFQPGPYQATYGASKAFVLSFSQALWAETRGSGVSVTALCPGPTRTGFVDALDADVSGTADLPEARITGTRCGRGTSSARSRTASGGDRV